MIIQADARHIPLADESVQCVVTSPPYFGLRDYGVAGQIGLEPMIDLYIDELVSVFSEVRRVLKDSGVVWVNLGDSYNGGNKGNSGQIRPGDKQGTNIGSWSTRRRDTGTLSPTRSGGCGDLKVKDLCMIPARVALALQASGWWLRSQIPWIKRNGMTESVKDRPTGVVEYVFLLSKSERYFYNGDAIKLPASLDTHARYARGRSNAHKWADGGPGNQTIAKSFEHMRAPGVNPKAAPAGSGIKQNESFSAAVKDVVETRNRRNSDWFIESWQGLLTTDDGAPIAFIVNSQGFKEAHFATFPPKFVTPMILAGSRSGDIILDPFGGSMTVVKVSQDLGRIGIGLDLKPEYLQMGKRRAAQMGLAV